MYIGLPVYSWNCSVLMLYVMLSVQLQKHIKLFYVQRSTTNWTVSVIQIRVLLCVRNILELLYQYMYLVLLTMGCTIFAFWRQYTVVGTEENDNRVKQND